MTLCMTSLTTSGNLVLTAASRAAYTCVKVGLAIYAFMIALARSPLPRIRFSLKSSMMMLEMFETLTLLMIPLIDFLSCSHMYF